MGPRVAALVAVLLGSTVPAGAQWRTVDTFEIKGAYGVIVVPENWNGGLFIYAHGYTADSRLIAPFPPDLSPDQIGDLSVLYQALVIPTLYGYASATTSFRSVGWYVKDAVKDIENVRRRFVARHGKPEHTYLWGHSGGGMVTQTVIERFPDTYDGALPMCAPGAGARRNFNAALDLRLTYDWICRDVPEARFACGICADGRARCLVDADCPGAQACSGRETPAPPEDGLSRECTEFLLAHPDRFSETPTAPGGDFVAGPASACFGDLSGATPPTAQQQARRDLFLRATQLPDSFIGTDMFFGTIGMGEVFHRRTRRRHAWGNEGVDYAPPLLTAAEREALNAGIRRVRESADAVRYMRAWYEPRGRTGARVLTVHALDDGLVIPENATKYQQAFTAAGRDAQLVQLFTATGGHCGFIAAIFPAFQALTAWVEEGATPTPAGIAAGCPACGFTDQAPGPFGVRVVERRQRGLPLRSLPCTGLANDCPAGTRCDLGTLHCRK